MQSRTIDRERAGRIRAEATDQWRGGRVRAAATFFLACFLLWVVVDFGTAGGFRPFGIPLAIAIYAPLTFSPLWLVRGEMGRHRRLVRTLCAIEVVVIGLSTLGKG